MKVVYWGTYDILKPRNRLMIRGLLENNIEVVQCHSDIWKGVDDKTQISNLEKGYFVLKWLLSYPLLLLRYLILPPHQAVVIGYMGILDILLLWPFARLRSVPIIFDPFVSCYNTVVEDRTLLSKINPLAFLLYLSEALACRLADAVILDTQEHAQYFIDTYRINPKKVHSVFVGAEPDYFFPSLDKAEFISDHFQVLFYGQFSPLHGVEIVFHAAKILENEDIEWLIIGKGQQAEVIEELITSFELPKLVWKDWVRYEDLNDLLHKADVSLGIFGKTAKGQRVIPNKVFQAIAAGCSVITQDSPAMRELIDRPQKKVTLLSDVSAAGLARAIMDILRNRASMQKEEHCFGIRQKITVKALGEKYANILKTLTTAL